MIYIGGLFRPGNQSRLRLAAPECGVVLLWCKHEFFPSRPCQEEDVYNAVCDHGPIRGARSRSRPPVCLRWKTESVLLMLGTDRSERLAAISAHSPHADVSTPSSVTEAFQQEEAFQHPVLGWMAPVLSN